MKKLLNRISIHPLTYIIILLSLLTGLFKYLLIISIIITIHEMGHIIVAKIFKRNINKINILPFGGLIKCDNHISSNIYEDLLIAVGGISLQLLFGGLLFIFKSHIRLYDIIYSYNKLIIAFNLIPICPLDGYKIVKHIQEIFFPFKNTFYLSFAASIALLITIIFFNRKLFLDNTLVFLFMIYMTLSEFINKKYVLNRFYLERILYDFSYKRKYINNTDKMYKNKTHIINGINERDALTNKLCCK